MALERLLLEDLAAGRFGFIDAGCGAGGSIDYCTRRFARGPGLGLDWYDGDLEVARRAGHTVAHCDLGRIELPPACVSFASMVDFLEHLDDATATAEVLRKLARASRDFLFIRHPSFEDIAYLARLGLKLGWTDWTGHTNMLRVDDFRRLFATLGWHDYVIHPDLPFLDSRASPIVPLAAPANVRDYDAALHGPKPRVEFDHPVYGNFNIFVRLSRALTDDAWECIQSMQGWQAEWEPASPTPERGVAPLAATPVELDAHQSIRLWSHDLGVLSGAAIASGPPTPSGQEAQPPGRDDSPYDSWMVRRAALPAIAPDATEALYTLLRTCAGDGAKALVALAHLLDAVLSAQPTRVLALGPESSGAAAFLACRFPALEVEATHASDLRPDGRQPKNLRVVRQPGGEFDFVFALRGFDPIFTSALELDGALAAVRVGGWLYGSGDQGPDFARARLSARARADGCRVVFARAIFDRRLVDALTVLLQTVDADADDALLAELARLALLDVEELAEPWRSERTGGKVLLRREQAFAGAAPVQRSGGARPAQDSAAPRAARAVASGGREPAWSGRVRSTSDFLDGLSLRLAEATGPADSTATLRLYEPDRADPIREARRRAHRDGEWLRFSFAPIQASGGREFAYELAGCRALSPDGETTRLHYGARLARLFDPWLARSGSALPPVPPHLERYLDRHVQECLRLERYFFLRLAHLADAVGRIAEPIVDVLSVGAGVAYQEAFLAGRLAGLRVTATDLGPPAVTFPIANLQREELDILAPPDGRQYDLVLSIECLEHITDYRRAFRHKAAMVRPGKYLYVSAPYASSAEQLDPELRRVAWDEFEHHTPGFTFADFEELFAENDLDVVHASNMFFLDVVLPVRRLVQRLSPGELDGAGAEIAQLLLLDLATARVPSARQAEGIRFLGRKRSR